MGIPYDDAFRIIAAEAESLSATYQKTAAEKVPLSKALNRIARHDYRCPESTPKWDTSAMDGYALNSETTQGASIESPVTYCVKGTVAAGDEPVSVSGEECENGTYPCVEIMTGARFPACHSGKPFDCCVRVEDTIRTDLNQVQILKPAKPNQNRRLAGEDFQTVDVIIRAGSIIRPHHIMALASVGFEELMVLRKPKIALFSTGKELLPEDESNQGHRINDVNGPYLSAVLEDLGYDPYFLGVLEDDAALAAQKIKRHLEHQQYDVIVTTGAVSAGKFDVIREAVDKLDGKILFHKVAMRPGHPALFATIPFPGTDLTLQRSKTAFFGLPGNPIASAACLRFLVVPFVRRLSSQLAECPVTAIVRTKADISFPPDMDVFRPATCLYRSVGRQEARLIPDHSPGKIKPFLGANCWVQIPRGCGLLRDRDAVDVFPII
jgi:molybdenum cofactor synthesis domain-containing protein